MASIVKRNNNFCVVYSYKDANGTPKQKWETFTDLSDAKNRKKEVEYKESVGTFVVPQCKTLNDLLPEYVALYGKSKWALSTYQANTALIANYITPLIGSMKLQDITTRVIEGYYQRLLKYEAADPMCGKRKHQFVSPSTVRSVHKILRSAFEQAVKWELMEKNPCIYATLPKYTSKKRDIWTAETLFRALKVCDDPKLRLCINLSFSCSLRLGELLGLTWDCVDISPESIEAGRASIYINKELQRVDVASLNALENKNVITRFPSLSSRCTTVQVLKSPKTDSSIRTIFLPKTVAEMLVEFKAEQDMTKEALGAEYTDYNLVVAGPLGMPTEQSTINGALKRLIEKNNLPKVVFHSFRHSSITYKLKLNGGDIKAVQGDSGHAQASMVTEQYAHILDDDRRLNAQRFDDFFYRHQGAEPEMPHQTAQPIPENSAVDADAAAAFVGVNRIFGLGLSEEDLMKRAVKVGADVPYCVMRGTALAEGIGEKLTRLPRVPQCYVLVGKPGVNVSTKTAYENLKLDDPAVVHPDIDGMVTAIREGDLDGMISRMGNVFEPGIIGKYPVIQEIKDLMENHGARKAMMSGSGPTVFGIFDSREKMEQAAAVLRESKLAKTVFATEVF